MKSLLLFIAFTLVLFASELQYEHNFNKAVEKANKQNKEVMMMYSAVWCPECNYMKDIVFKDEKVLDYIQKHYVVLALDIQKDTLPKGFKYIGIPTFFFLNKDAKEKNQIIGGSKVNIFLQKLKALK
jgi:thiol:disulfide interchange protein